MKTFAAAALMTFLGIVVFVYVSEWANSMSLAVLVLLPLLAGWIAMMVSSAWTKLNQRLEQMEETIARLKGPADDDRDDG